MGLTISDCRYQVSDEASNMRSDWVGVQDLIRMDAPKAVYMHCSGHCLNLAITTSCALPMVRNTMDKIKSTVYFIIFSWRLQRRKDIQWRKGRCWFICAGQGAQLATTPIVLLHCVCLYSEDTWCYCSWPAQRRLHWQCHNRLERKCRTEDSVPFSHSVSVPVPPGR